MLVEESLCTMLLLLVLQVLSLASPYVPRSRSTPTQTALLTILVSTASFSAWLMAAVIGIAAQDF
jgi:hypothetical protein